MKTKDALLNELEQVEATLVALKKDIELLSAKPSPRQRLLGILDGCTVRIDKEKYPNSTFLFKNDACFFDIDKQYLWCSFNHVWDIFYKEYSMSYSDIQALIKGVVEEAFKLKGLTPRWCMGNEFR